MANFSDLVNLRNISRELFSTVSPEDKFLSMEFNEEHFSHAVLKSREIQATLLNLPQLIQEKLWVPLFDGMNDGEQILDIGSGSAFHLEALGEELRRSLTLLDIVAPLLDKAQGLYPEVHTIRRDWNNTELPDESVKRISAFNADVFCGNIDEHRELLEECERILAPGGKMIMLSIEPLSLEWIKSYEPCEPKDSAKDFHELAPDLKRRGIENFQRFQRDFGHSENLTTETTLELGKTFALKNVGGLVQRDILRLSIEKPLV